MGAWHPDAGRGDGFYTRFGLERLSDELPARMVLDLKPLLELSRAR